jgi:hypothetical protein
MPLGATDMEQRLLQLLTPILESHAVPRSHYEMLASSSHCKEARRKKILQDEVGQVSPSSTIPDFRTDWKISA